MILKKIGIILLAGLLLISGCQKKKPCVASEGIVCFEKDSGQYQIEENAKVRVNVETEEYGQALIDLWNTSHPEQMDVIEPVVTTSFDSQTWLSDQTDIALLWNTDAVLLEGNFQVFQPDLQEMIALHVPQQFGAALNAEGMRYVAMNYYGLVFSTNKTMLEEMGNDSTDENHDGLLDQFDTFEEIMQLSEQWGGQARTYRNREVSAIFPISFTDFFSSFGYLSAGNYKPFSTLDATQPGFDSPEFLTALQFINQLGSVDWYLNNTALNLEAQVESKEEESEETDSQEPTPSLIPTESIDPESPLPTQQPELPYDQRNEPALQPGWLYDVYLEKLVSPFSMVGSWMYYQQQEEIEQQDFQFSAMPTWQSQPLAPLALTKGYLINVHTQYPSACNEVLRLIRSNEAIQAYIDTTQQIPAVTNTDRLENKPAEQELSTFPDASATPDAWSLEEWEGLYFLDFHDENRRQLSQAFSASQEEVLVAYPLDTTVSGWDMLEEINILELMKMVFTHQMSPEQAQQDFVTKAQAWMQPFVPTEEPKQAK